MSSEVTDGYWVFYEGLTYTDDHPEYFRWFARANRAISRGNWAWAWDRWCRRTASCRARAPNHR